jgi:hypothetical protein
MQASLRPGPLLYVPRSFRLLELVLSAALLLVFGWWFGEAPHALEQRGRPCPTTAGSGACPGAVRTQPGSGDRERVPQPDSPGRSGSVPEPRRGVIPRSGRAGPRRCAGGAFCAGAREGTSIGSPRGTAAARPVADREGGDPVAPETARSIATCDEELASPARHGAGQRGCFGRARDRSANAAAIPGRSLMSEAGLRAPASGSTAEGGFRG